MFTHKPQEDNELGVKVKGEGKDLELAECAMRRRVSAKARGDGRERTVQGVAEEETLPFPQKREGECKKMGRFRRKVHKFLPTVLFLRRKPIFSCLKLRLFEMYRLSLRLIKHNLPFFLPPGGVHIARIHGIFLRVETQTLFDLLNDFSSCPRGG